jgi:hypothetical protein
MPLPLSSSFFKVLINMDILGVKNSVPTFGIGHLGMLISDDHHDVEVKLPSNHFWKE